MSTMIDDYLGLSTGKFRFCEDYWMGGGFQRHSEEAWSNVRLLKVFAKFTLRSSTCLSWDWRWEPFKLLDNY